MLFVDVYMVENAIPRYETPTSTSRVFTKDWFIFPSKVAPISGKSKSPTLVHFLSCRHFLNVDHPQWFFFDIILSWISIYTPPFLGHISDPLLRRRWINCCKRVAQKGRFRYDIQLSQNCWGKCEGFISDFPHHCRTKDINPTHQPSVSVEFWFNLPQKWLP